jgi:hypothetical protein
VAPNGIMTGFAYPEILVSLRALLARLSEARAVA